MHLIKLLTVENQKNSDIFDSIDQYFEILNHSNWIKKYIFWEFNLLKLIGFDLDLKKMLTKIWKSKQEIMLIVVFSSTEEGLKFFSESFDTIKGKTEKNLFLILSGKIGKKIKIKSDLTFLSSSNLRY